MLRHWKAFVRPGSEFDTFAVACATFGQHPGDVLGIVNTAERYDLLMASYVAVSRHRFEQREGEIELLALRIQHRLDEWFSGNPCPPLRRNVEESEEWEGFSGVHELSLDDIPD